MTWTTALALYGAAVGTAGLIWQVRRWSREHGIWVEAQVMVCGRWQGSRTEGEARWDIAIRLWNRGSRPVTIEQMALDPNVIRWFDPRLRWAFPRLIFGQALLTAQSRRLITHVRDVSIEAGDVRLVGLPVEELASLDIDPESRLRGVVWLRSGHIVRSRRMKPVQTFDIPDSWERAGKEL